MPCLTLVNAGGDGRVDANDLHHAIHQLDLMENPVEYWPAIAEITHVPLRRQSPVKTKINADAGI